MFKVIVAGGRNFSFYRLLSEKLDTLLANKTDIQIVSGKASGADSLGEDYAKEKGYPIKDFPAQWDDMSEPCVRKTNKAGKEYNALAGHKRNEQMAEYADACVCFWDGKSTGTADMIERAKKHKLLLRVVRYDK